MGAKFMKIPKKCTKNSKKNDYFVRSAQTLLRNS